MRAESPDDPRGTAHRGGDVVELQVQEDLVPLGTESHHGLGSGRSEQFESDLGHAEPGPDASRQANCDDEIVDVEGQSQTVARISDRAVQ